MVIGGTAAAAATMPTFPALARPSVTGATACALPTREGVRRSWMVVICGVLNDHVPTRLSVYR